MKTQEKSRRYKGLTLGYQVLNCKAGSVEDLVFKSRGSDEMMTVRCAQQQLPASGSRPWKRERHTREGEETAVAGRKESVFQPVCQSSSTRGR